MTVKEYMNKFDVVRCDIHEDSRLTLSRFRTGLRPTLQREMLLHAVESVDVAFQLALGIESYLQTPSDRKSFKVGSHLSNRLKIMINLTLLSPRI